MSENVGMENGLYLARYGGKKWDNLIVLVEGDKPFQHCVFFEHGLLNRVLNATRPSQLSQFEWGPRLIEAPE